MKIKVADDVPAEVVKDAGAVNVKIRLLIHEAEGAPHFYMRQFTIAPGGCTPHHAHAWEHEVYVLAGSGVAASAEGDRPIRAGQCVFVPPNEKHQFRNTGDEDMKFLCLVPRM